jgi:hypothetical protein
MRKPAVCFRRSFKARPERSSILTVGSLFLIRLVMCAKCSTAKTRQPTAQFAGRPPRLSGGQTIGSRSTPEMPPACAVSKKSAADRVERFGSDPTALPTSSPSKSDLHDRLLGLVPSHRRQRLRLPHQRRAVASDAEHRRTGCLRFTPVALEAEDGELTRLYFPKAGGWTSWAVSLTRTSQESVRTNAGATGDSRHALTDYLSGSPCDTDLRSPSISHPNTAPAQWTGCIKAPSRW